MASSKTLILGLGNDILSDDRIGLLLVNDLAEINIGPDIRFATASSGGLEIMELIKDYDRVIIVDAVRFRDGKPGNFYHFIPSDLRETSNLSNLHDINFFNALQLGKILELNLPDDIHIIGVEIIEDMEFGDSLTPILEKKYPEIFAGVSAVIKKILEKI
jgi:hydrogenase maturation protease